MRILAVATTEANGTVTGVHPDDTAAEAALQPGEELGSWTMVLQDREFFRLKGPHSVATFDFAEAYTAAAAAGTEVFVRMPTNPLKRSASVPRNERYYQDRPVVRALATRSRRA